MRSDYLESDMEIAEILKNVLKAENLYEKLEYINQSPHVSHLMSQKGPLQTFIASLSLDCEYVIKVLIATGGEKALHIPPKEFPSKLRSLTQTLLSVEDYYIEIGGL